MGTIVSSSVTLVGCLTIAFVSGWKLALVVLAFIPFIIFGSAMEVKVNLGGSAGNSVDSEEAGKVRLLKLKKV